MLCFKGYRLSSYKIVDIVDRNFQPTSHSDSTVGPNDREMGAPISTRPSASCSTNATITSIAKYPKLFGRNPSTRRCHFKQYEQAQLSLS